MIGIEPHPESTLLERVLERLRGGPATSQALCREVLGIAAAPPAVADRLAWALLAADPRVHQLAEGSWALVAEAQGSPLIEDCAFAVVDVETTGRRPGSGDRITEIAVVVVQGPRREVVFESLVNPGCPVPARIAEITGITDGMLAGAPAFGDVADQVLGALAGRVFVAHNARFDWGFVEAECRRARGVALDGPRICTVRLARRLAREAGSAGLDNLMHFFGLDNPARHRAAGDALATSVLLKRLVVRARERGARTLADLEFFSRSRSRSAGGPVPAAEPAA